MGILVKRAIAAVLALAGIFWTAGLRVNTTESFPLGLYIRTASADGLVEFCPEGPTAAEALERGYRPPGACRDGGEPLMKEVVAKAGDVVEVSADGIRVNRRLLPNTAPVSTDSRGRLLWPYAPGRHRVDPGTVWVASTYNPRSYDSRYFGPIRVATVRGGLRPLLVKGMITRTEHP